MLCFRCGSYNQDGSQQCSVCGQTFVEGSAGGGDGASLDLGTGKGGSPYQRGDLIAGRYKVRALIGHGGVGSVYRVRDEEIDAEVALKSISPNLLQTDEERKLFSRCIRQARKLHHPNIIRIYDEGQDGDRRFFTMKLLEGLTLRKIIRLRHDKGQSFSPEEIVPIFHQLAAALDYAHKTTWHGDLKPENVIILPDLLKITDFNLVKGLPLKPFLGIAKSKSKGFPYVAPELRVEASKIDRRADIYSLGVILGEMLTGMVFEGHFSRAMTAALERLPSKLDGLVRRAVAEHPDGRFSKASELAKELEAALGALEGTLPSPATSGEIEKSVKKKPPPPPAETSPGLVPESGENTAEDRPVSPASPSEPELSLSGEGEPQEIGQSQVLLLETGMSEALADSRMHAAAMGGAPLPPVAKGPAVRAETPGDHIPPPVSDDDDHGDLSAPSLKDGRVSLKAEDLIETLYSENDDGLIPPPLPSDEGLDASDSYDSLPKGVVTVSGEGGKTQARGLPVDEPFEPPPLSEEDEEEPTLSDHGGKLRIHQELTALKAGAGKDGKVEPVMPPALPGPIDDEDSLEETLPAEALKKARERSSPRLHSTPALTPPVVSPGGPGESAPHLRPVAPPATRPRSNMGTFVAGTAVAVVLVVAAVVGFKASGNGPDNPEPEVAPPVAVPGSALIGPAGGVVELNGVTLVVPGGALVEEKTLRITRAADGQPEGFEAFSPVFRITPSDTRFEKAVKLTIPFTGGDVDARLYWRSGEGGDFVAVEGGVIAGGAVAAPLNDLGTGFVGRALAAADAGPTVALADPPTDPPVEAGGQRDTGTAVSTTRDPAAEERRAEEERRREEERRAAEEKKRQEELERREEAAEERRARAEERRLEEERKDAERRAKSEMEAREREEEKRRKDEERREEAERKKEEREEKRRAEAEEKKRKEEEKKAQEEAERKKKEEEARVASAKKAECPKGMAMIAAGEFAFGSAPSDPMRNFGEKTATRATVSAFCIDYYEFPNGSSAVPTTGVTWSAAKKACEKKGKRLCSEVEWEYACKGPSDRRFPYGNNYKADRCNTEDADGNPRPLASAADFKACRSKFNIFNLAGNAEEWTADNFRSGASSKVIKGGAADRPDWASRCAARRGEAPTAKKATLGFRCCADPG